MSNKTNKQTNKQKHKKKKQKFDSVVAIVNAGKKISYKHEISCFCFFHSFADRWNLEERTVEEMFSAAAMVRDILSMNPNCQINGIVGLWNVDGLDSRHFKLLLDKRLWALLSFGQVRIMIGLL